MKSLMCAFFRRVVPEKKKKKEEKKKRFNARDIKRYIAGNKISIARFPDLFIARTRSYYSRDSITVSKFRRNYIEIGVKNNGAKVTRQYSLIVVSFHD